MSVLRRQLLPAILMVVVLTLILCVGYPAVSWGIGNLFFHNQVNGEMVKLDGRVVGSKLIGQSFDNAAGDPLPQFFQPRPSETYDQPYDPAAGSNASNLGPSSPLLIGFVPGVNTVERDGAAYPRGARQVNPFATTADPFCVPMSVAAKGSPSAPVTAPSAGEHFVMSGGSYACDPDTIPERAIAYRQFNGMPADAIVPADAVTASASGLDPDISPANADDQAPRVARVDHLPIATVLRLVADNTTGPQLGFIGEKVVNVLELNIDLVKLTQSGR